MSGIKKRLNKARKARREEWNRTRIESGGTEKLCLSQRSHNARLAKKTVKTRTENKREHTKPSKFEQKRTEHNVIKPILVGGRLWVLKGIPRKAIRRVKDSYPNAFWSVDMKAFCWLDK